MLFDLRGRRRHAVQGIYLTLAVLMGGGLVFFGIGGNVGGGLLDAFKGGGGGGGNSAITKRIDRDEKRLQANPNNVAALKAMVRDNYALATAKTPSGATAFSQGAKDDLRKGAAAWQRYLAVEKGTPDAALANFALQMFAVEGLNQPKQAQQAAQIVAQAQPSAAAYLRVVQYATLARDTRTADLAGKKAIDLAPKDQKAAAKAQVKQAKQLRSPQG